MLDGGEGGCPGAPVMTRDLDDVCVGFCHSACYCANAGLRYQLDRDLRLGGDLCKHRAALLQNAHQPTQAQSSFVIKCPPMLHYTYVILSKADEAQLCYRMHTNVAVHLCDTVKNR